VPQQELALNFHANVPPHTVPGKVTGCCGSVLGRLISAVKTQPPWTIAGPRAA